MKKIVIIIIFISVYNSSFAQNTWVKHGTHLFLKQGNDSTDFGEDFWSTMPDIVSAINAKQAPLVSGNNIKTIKGQPVLGSGDITLVWGDLTGTLANQTDLQNAINARLAANGNGSSLTGLTASQVGLGNVNNTSDANKPISTATQTALDAKQATLVSGTNIKTINSTDITGSGNVVIAGVNSTTTFLPSDVINNNASANTIADVTGLSFAVSANVTYRFKFFIVYSSAATTTGSRWSINGPATTFMHYRSTYTVNAGSESINSGNAAYNVPAAANASSLATGNIAIIEGIIRPSAGGTVIARFASEISASAITAIGSGRSFVEFQAIN